LALDSKKSPELVAPILGSVGDGHLDEGRWLAAPLGYNAADHRQEGLLGIQAVPRPVDSECEVLDGSDMLTRELD